MTRFVIFISAFPTLLLACPDFTGTYEYRSGAPHTELVITQNGCKELTRTTYHFFEPQKITETRTLQLDNEPTTFKHMPFETYRHRFDGEDLLEIAEPYFVVQDTKWMRWALLPNDDLFVRLGLLNKAGSEIETQNFVAKRIAH